MDAEVASLLDSARHRIVELGWWPIPRPGKTTLFDVVWADGADWLVRLRARELIERLANVDQLFKWDELPMASQAEAIRLLEAGMRKCGVEPKPIHRGGWFVSPYQPRRKSA